MIYFDTVKKVDLEDLDPGDLFKVYLRSYSNENSGLNRFYGKLTKITEMKFKCYCLGNASTFARKENDCVPKCNFERSLQNDFFYNQDRILDIFKVKIREVDEVHEYENERHPSTFMNDDEYELI